MSNMTVAATAALGRTGEMTTGDCVSRTASLLSWRGVSGLEPALKEAWKLAEPHEWAALCNAHHMGRELKLELEAQA